MICKIVSDSSCDLRMSEFDSGELLFETVPLRLQVGEREFVDNDELEIPQLLGAMAQEKAAAKAQRLQDALSKANAAAQEAEAEHTRLRRELEEQFAQEGGEAMLAELEQNNILDCIECGCCAYVCPAKRDMVTSNKLAKRFMADEARKAKEKEAKKA